jgi:ABC-type sulfate transport system substrate-binding protein
MKLTAFALLAGSAAAFAPTQSNTRVSTQAAAGIDDLKADAIKLNPIVKVSLLMRSSETVLSSCLISP